MALKRLRLIQRRKALGYTQEALAEQVGCERTTVIRWERAETEPQPWVRPRLSLALQLTPEELNELLADVSDVPGERDGFTLVTSVPLDFSLSTAYTVRIMEGFSAHDIASRRDALTNLAVLTGAMLLHPVRQWAASLALLPGSPPGAGTDEIAELEQAVTMFRRWDAGGAGGLRRKAVAGQLNAVAEGLNDHHSPAITQRLFQVTAELAQLCGWMAYDQGLYGVAQRYYLLVLHACREGSCPDLGAKVIGDMTQLSTVLGRYDDSLGMVRTALYSLPRQASPLVRSELLGLESRAYAQLGTSEPAGADRSAQACVAVYEEASPQDATPDWIHYMTQAEVDCLAANAYIQLALNANNKNQWRHYAAKGFAVPLGQAVLAAGGPALAADPDAVRAMIRVIREYLAALPAPPVPRGFAALQTLPQGLLVAMLRRFLRSPTAAYSGLSNASPAETAELERVAEQMRAYARAQPASIPSNTASCGFSGTTPCASSSHAQPGNSAAPTPNPPLHPPQH